MTAPATKITTPAQALAAAFDGTGIPWTAAPRVRGGEQALAYFLTIPMPVPEAEMLPPAPGSAPPMETRWRNVDEMMPLAEMMTTVKAHALACTAVESLVVAGLLHPLSGAGVVDVFFGRLHTLDPRVCRVKIDPREYAELMPRRGPPPFQHFRSPPFTLMDRLRVTYGDVSHATRFRIVWVGEGNAWRPHGGYIEVHDRAEGPVFTEHYDAKPAAPLGESAAAAVPTPEDLRAARRGKRDAARRALLAELAAGRKARPRRSGWSAPL